VKKRWESTRGSEIVVKRTIVYRTALIMLSFIYHSINNYLRYLIAQRNPFIDSSGILWKVIEAAAMHTRFMAAAGCITRHHSGMHYYNRDVLIIHSVLEFPRRDFARLQ
jgi:hypothetical protein